MPAPKQPPTMREIARRAGVSHTTVSLALRNNPEIPAATRERIQNLADSMGYRSNMLVSALMTQVRLRQPRTTAEVIGFLTAGPASDDWKNHSASVGAYEGASIRARQLGMRLETFWLGPDGEKARETCRLLNVRAIWGNFIAPFPVPVYDHELDWDKLTCIAFGYAYPQHRLHRVIHHHFRDSFTAFDNLHRLGYSRIGLMLDHYENSRVHYSWLGGYLAAQTIFRGDALQPLLAADDDIARVREWLQQVRPDAVIGFGPKEIVTLNRAGYSVPGDIAFAALDVQQARLASLKQVSGIDQNHAAIGATAIDTLAAQLYHNERGMPRAPVLAMIEGFWVDGRTAPPKARELTMASQESSKL